MRTDEGTKYSLPGLVHNDPDQAKYWKRGITFDLQGLPMIHEDGVQTGVGARGWYNSAVLSAMLLLFSSSSSSTSASISSSSSDPATDSNNNTIMGDLLRQDMINLMKQQEIPNQKNPTVLEIGAGAVGLVGMTMAWILSHKQLDTPAGGGTEDSDGGGGTTSGGGATSTAGTSTSTSTEETTTDVEDDAGDDDMVMHHLRQQMSKVILTDNDQECLTQLQCNVTSVLRSLLEFNSVMHKDGGSTSAKSNGNNIKSGEDSKEEQQEEHHSPWSALSNQEIPFLSLPSIQTKILDWDDHAIDQDVLVNHKIDFVVGAELAYTHNNCCAMQVAKILELNPRAVIWIVQFPRKGWFQVFQMELQKAMPNIVIQKMDPTNIHTKVHQLAQSIMPMPCGMGSNRGNEDTASHQQFSQNLEDIKALRITRKQQTSTTGVGEQQQQQGEATKTTQGETTATSNKGPKLFDLKEQIQQAKRSSQLLNDTQEFALDSHWEIG
mmetsp:Transcript_35506/g.86066  ORF Transcript_35506/g.86066 Transcript_35506/m.86066 type:complete len:493 (+) Transcript_35506:157-1635(+)